MSFRCFILRGSLRLRGSFKKENLERLAMGKGVKGACGIVISVVYLRFEKI